MQSFGTFHFDINIRIKHSKWYIRLRKYTFRIGALHKMEARLPCDNVNKIRELLTQVLAQKKVILK